MPLTCKVCAGNGERSLFRFPLDRAQLRVDSAFEANRKAVGPHSRVSVISVGLL